MGAYAAATYGAWFIETRAGNMLFLAGAWLATLIGVWFSANQLVGAAECPSFEGLPTCFVSLLAGATMLAADLLRRRLASSPSRSIA